MEMDWKGKGNGLLEMQGRRLAHRPTRTKMGPSIFSDPAYGSAGAADEKLGFYKTTYWVTCNYTSLVSCGQCVLLGTRGGGVTQPSRGSLDEKHTDQD
jgi:hypothetical protein